MTRLLTPEQARRRAALVLAKGREVTISDVAKISGMSLSQATAAIVALCEMGLLEAGSVARYRVYRLKRKEARNDNIRGNHE